MYLCICNAITDRDVGRAVTQGCASVSEVFRHLGERPNCGRCVPEICRAVQQAQVLAQDISGDLAPAPMLAAAAE
jgi:bacterioferritin-associated ferredoxin